jgi:hypothetical protein
LYGSKRKAVNGNALFAQHKSAESGLDLEAKAATGECKWLYVPKHVNRKIICGARRIDVAENLRQRTTGSVANIVAMRWDVLCRGWIAGADGSASGPPRWRRPDQVGMHAGSFDESLRFETGVED